MKSKLIVLLISACLIFLSACKSDPCADVTCNNGGHCANGSCVCPSGYGGSDCSSELTPKSITVTKITVTRFPANNSGTSWDPSDGPDIFPEININNTTLWESDSYFENVTTGKSYTFVPTTNIVLNPGTRYGIDLYDYDSPSPPDWMAGILFFPYKAGNHFPNPITVDAGGTVAFKLYVVYTW